MRNSLSLHLGNCMDVLNFIPDESVDCAVTSPPYWNQRMYGDKHEEIGFGPWVESYVFDLSYVFGKVYRVLKPTGTLWINLGDKYHRKSLSLAPERLAIALSHKWVLRDKIVWHKPNPMPESVKNRCTNAHEFIYMFTKDDSKYYFNADAIKTDSKKPIDNRSETGRKRMPTAVVNGMRKSGVYPKANKRNVWTVPVQAFPGAHTAVMPLEIAETCILAGCPEGGTVLDPFMGTGTTGVAALKLDRQFVGIELYEECMKIAQQRLEI